MIQTILDDISTQLRARLPWVNEVVSIARQDLNGVVKTERPEAFAGIDDRKPGRAYIRFRDGWDSQYTDGRIASAKSTKTTDMLRVVLTHDFVNEIELSRFFSLTIAQSFNAGMKYTVEIKRKSTDKQFIITNEMMNEKGTNDDRIRLIMVDFDVTYTDLLANGETCIPQARVC